MADKSIDTEKYQGPGRLTAAVGDAKIYTIAGSIAGLGVGAGGAALVKPDGKIGNLINRVSNFFGGVEKSHLTSALGGAKTSKGVLILAGAVVGSTVLGILGFGYGLFHGWGKGNKGEMQFNAIKAERDEARNTIAAMRTQVQGLESEVATHRKKFADQIASRADHGSHANTVSHDKAHAQAEGAAR